MASQSDRNLTIQSIPSSIASKTKGFFAQSTAPINVEDQPTPLTQTFDEIKTAAVQVLLESSDPQINIYVHGYAEKHPQAKERTEALHRTAQQSHHPGQLVFGFLWPCENPVQDNGQINQDPPIRPPGSIFQKFRAALVSLPTVLLIALFSSLILGLTAWGVLLFPNLTFSAANATVLAALVALLSLSLLTIAKALYLFTLAIVHVLSALAIFWFSQFSVGHGVTLILSGVMPLLFGMIFALIILRLVTYLRDRERASYFAVYDLVELVRKLDKAIAEQGEQQGIPRQDWKLESELKPGETGRRRVQLNIMAHSLGCMVVTNAIRILSDVFDPEAVAKSPNSKLGQTLTLERLVLVAPDIPIEAVLPGRSNFLTSTLDRCSEPYVFSNEGDLALRLASTAANYFGYFSRTRFGGYRLGNITYHRTSKRITYGIMNDVPGHPPYQMLGIRSSKREQKTLVKLYDDRPNSGKESWKTAIADKITHFDCTDYKDFRQRGESVSKTMIPMMTEAKGKPVLSFYDYCSLGLKYLVTKQIDTHGGYFEGHFSQELLHGLLLSGFKQYLEGYHNSSLETFNQAVIQKQIQVVVSHQFSKKFCLTRPIKTA
jgi:hypothetical protein